MLLYVISAVSAQCKGASYSSLASGFIQFSARDLQDLVNDLHASVSGPLHLSCCFIRQLFAVFSSSQTSLREN